jgi:hypothetical protein
MGLNKCLCTVYTWLEGKQLFLQWFHDYDMPEKNDWLIVGDFNLIWRPSDRNKVRG